MSALVRDCNCRVLESAPMVTMRIESVRGVPVRELEKKGEVPSWVLRREFRSTYRDHLNATETLVAGEWFTRVPDPNGPVPLSLEEKSPSDLGVALGDETHARRAGRPGARPRDQPAQGRLEPLQSELLHDLPARRARSRARLPRRHHARAAGRFLRRTAARRSSSNFPMSPPSTSR